MSAQRETFFMQSIYTVIQNESIEKSATRSDSDTHKQGSAAYRTVVAGSASEPAAADRTRSRGPKRSAGGRAAAAASGSRRTAQRRSAQRPPPPAGFGRGGRTLLLGASAALPAVTVGGGKTICCFVIRGLWPEKNHNCVFVFPFLLM